ncbi:MAG: ROK family transcriptional regulator [Firmicutes bacterium]|nr:ROK family transcriptional regulator [Bacillota bacterium]
MAKLKGHNAADIKNRNLSVIIRTIKKAEMISRTELADETGLSNPAVGNLVAELVQLGLVREMGSVNQPVGRSRVLLTLNDESVQVIGIEIARNGVYGVLADMKGTPIATSEKSFAPGSTSDIVLGALYEVIGETFTSTKQRKAPLIGIGIGTPGPVNVEKGKVFEPPNFPGLQNVSLKHIIEERYHAPCYLNDDARTSALGEAWFGAGQDVSSLVFISLGEGIGSGVIFDHHLYEGTHDIAGQIGHFTVEPKGRRCDCGNIGCLETLASIPAIAWRARTSGVVDACDVSDGTVVLRLVDAYHSGEPGARKLFDETLDYIVTAVVSAINSYDPEMVVLGGRLVRTYPEMVDIVRRRVVARCYYHIANDLRIVASQLGPKTSALGAIVLLLQRLLYEPVATLEAAVRW